MRMESIRRLCVVLGLGLGLLLGGACESDGDGAPGGGADGAGGVGGADVAEGVDAAGAGDDAAAADDDAAAAGDDAAAAALAIAGTYTDDWGTAHEISADTWTQTYPGAAPYVFHVTQYSNEDGWLVAQNDEANEFSGGAWSRFDWLWVEADLYYCQSAYDAESEEAALAAPAANADDPANAGCGPGPWTHLVP